MAAQVILARQPDQIADHRARNGRRETLHGIERSAAVAGGQQITGQGPDIGLECADAARTKPRRQQVAPQIMLGWIHARDAIEHLRASRRGREAHMVSCRLTHIGEASQHKGTARRVVKHRVLVTQDLVGRVRVAVEIVGAQRAHGDNHTLIVRERAASPIATTGR